MDHQNIIQHSQLDLIPGPIPERKAVKYSMDWQIYILVTYYCNLEKFCGGFFEDMLFFLQKKYFTRLNSVERPQQLFE
jgi:hypothetical protein